MKVDGMSLVVGAVLNIVCEYRWQVFESDVIRSGANEGMVVDPDALAFFDEIDPIIADCRAALEVLADMAGAPSSAALSIEWRRIVGEAERAGDAA